MTYVIVVALVVKKFNKMFEYKSDSLVAMGMAVCVQKHGKILPNNQKL